MDSKVCGHCRALKPLSQFNNKATGKDGKQTDCKDCNRERSKRYYRENHDKHIGVIRAYKNRRRREVKCRIDVIKSVNGCALCPEDDPVCLEFHHVEPGHKDFDIGCAKRTDWKWSTIVQEIRKCVVLCSNCHKKVHAGKRTVLPHMACDIPGTVA